MFFIGIGSYKQIKDISRTEHNLPRLGRRVVFNIQIYKVGKYIENKHHKQYVEIFWQRPSPVKCSNEIISVAKCCVADMVYVLSYSILSCKKLSMSS